MSQRYDTLNVSLQTDNRNPSKLVKTLDYQNASYSDNQQADSDGKVRRFRELYYKNEKLRRELKALNEKLNERLQKVKLPNVRRKTMSVDLNQTPANPVSKAQMRELENAYKQIKMYKQQIQILKVKEQTPQNYAKVRDMENEVIYKDKEISEVQEQLKSIRNIKKMQDKRIVSDLQNEDVVERITLYQRELKGYKEKLKDMARKGRKREEEYKKQQAYLVTLQKRLRGTGNEDQGKIDPEALPEKQINALQWDLVKKEAAKEKQRNDEVLKKIEAGKKQIKTLKTVHEDVSDKLEKTDTVYRNLLIKLDSLRTLIKQQDRLDREREKQKQKQKDRARLEDIKKFQAKIQEDSGDQEDNENSLSKKQSLISSIRKDQRQWKGKTRKVQHGFMAPTDERFQALGQLRGLKMFLDQNQAISGFSPVIKEGKSSKQGQIFGNKTNVEVKWQTNQADQIGRITGSFSEQGYLIELMLMTKNGMSAKFGKSQSSTEDIFKFKLEEDERIEGIFGAVRKLNKDSRITELGFWIAKTKLIEQQQKSLAQPSSWGFRQSALLEQ